MLRNILIIPIWLILLTGLTAASDEQSSDGLLDFIPQGLSLPVEEDIDANEWLIATNLERKFCDGNHLLRIVKVRESKLLIRAIMQAWTNKKNINISYKCKDNKAWIKTINNQQTEKP